jgi:hypothetical protein
MYFDQNDIVFYPNSKKKEPEDISSGYCSSSSLFFSQENCSDGHLFKAFNA